MIIPESELSLATALTVLLYSAFEPRAMSLIVVPEEADIERALKLALDEIGHIPELSARRLGREILFSNGSRVRVVSLHSKPVKVDRPKVALLLDVELTPLQTKFIGARRVIRSKLPR